MSPFSHTTNHCLTDRLSQSNSTMRRNSRFSYSDSIADGVSLVAVWSLVGAAFVFDVVEDDDDDDILTMYTWFSSRCVTTNRIREDRETQRRSRLSDPWDGTADVASLHIASKILVSSCERSERRMRPVLASATAVG